VSVPEVVAGAGAPDLDAGALAPAAQGVYVVADRPNSPGNLGSLVRSAEAFGAKAVLSYGHAADFFDPKAIRASIGAVFALPLARQDGPEQFQRWLAGLRQGGTAPTVAALDENGTVDAWKLPKGGVTVMIVGNETDGLSKVFKEACTAKVRIPMTGTATSLNAANSGSILLYELLVRPA
jgi:TrmH family RNA methyltransferase